MKLLKLTKNDLTLTSSLNEEKDVEEYQIMNGQSLLKTCETQEEAENSMSEMAETWEEQEATSDNSLRHIVELVGEGKTIMSSNGVHYCSDGGVFKFEE